MTPDHLTPLLKQLDSEIRYREAHGLRDHDTALFRDCRLALQQAAQDVQMGHARLNECAGWEATKDLSLYDRISKKIEELVYAKSEVEHLLAATGHEKDALQAKAEAAEHRRAAAEYRATRIELDKELQGQLKAAKSHVAALTAEIAQLKQRYAEYGATEDDLAPFRQIAALTAQIQALRELSQAWREEAGPRPHDDIRTFPAGHDMTERRYVLHRQADELDALLVATPLGATPAQS